MNPELHFDPDTHTYTLRDTRLPSVTDICSPITAGALSKIAPEVIQHASLRGHLVHEACCDIDYGAPPEDCPPDLYGYLQAYRTFLRDYMPTWVFVERIVLNESKGYAGTLDRLGVIDHKLYLIDLKTSAMNRAQRVSLAVQIAGYRAALYDEGVIPDCYDSEDVIGMGVQLKSNGKYTVHLVSNIESRYGFLAPMLWNDLLKLHKITGGYQ